MSNSTSLPKSESGPLPMPVETEIYILPNGEIVVADLPAELVSLIAARSPGTPDGESDRQAE